MFSRRVSVFRLLGFPVWVDTSWIILAILMAWSLAIGVFPTEAPGLSRSEYWGMAAIGVLGLFGCILIHEFSHALVARHYGMRAGGITLFLFGGVAEMQDEPRNPKMEFQIAAVGPMVSAVLGSLFNELTLDGLTYNWGPAITGVLSYLGTINLALAAFNLIPAFPLDGGRILRAMIWKWKKDLRFATRIASRSGEFFGILLMLTGAVGFFYGNFLFGMWWILMGLFLKEAATLGYRQVALQDALDGETVERLMTPNPITVPPSLTLRDFVDHYLYRYHHRIFPVVDGRHLLGCMHLDELGRIPTSEWKRHTVRELMVPCSRQNTIAPSARAEEALQRMERMGTTRLLVTQNERILGIISLKDMMRLLSIKMEVAQTLEHAA